MKLQTKLSSVAMLMILFAVSLFSQDSGAIHGKEIYAIQKCALCHAISGVGGKKLSLDGLGSRLKPEAVRRWIRTPREMKPDTTMKAYPNLPEKDLSDLVEYLMTLR
jgi:mono/diheme cytochrome c family protein